MKLFIEPHVRQKPNLIAGIALRLNGNPLLQFGSVLPLAKKPFLIT
jgi:hypothetical protein